MMYTTISFPGLGLEMNSSSSISLGPLAIHWYGVITYSTADRTYDDYSNYGYLSSTSDVDWWKVVFDYAGSANFYLGNVPSGSDYDIRLYASNGTTLLASSLKGSNASELITYTVNMGTTYYIRINAAKGGSSTARYLFRTKVYPSKNIAAVPLYE